jgi:hypothetical protein
MLNDTAKSVCSQEQVMGVEGSPENILIRVLLKTKENSLTSVLLKPRQFHISSWLQL